MRKKCAVEIDANVFKKRTGTKQVNRMLHLHVCKDQIIWPLTTLSGNLGPKPYHNVRVSIVSAMVK